MKKALSHHFLTNFYGHGIIFLFKVVLDIVEKLSPYVMT